MKANWFFTGNSLGRLLCKFSPTGNVTIECESSNAGYKDKQFDVKVKAWRMQRNPDGTEYEIGMGYG